MSREIEILLAAIDQAYDTKSWHGTNLRGSLRGVTAEQAAWRPAPGRHNIWELTLHAAYWKYVVWRRLSGGDRGAFPLEGSNFFTRPVVISEKAWKGDIAILQKTHDDLRALVASYPPRLLDKRPPGSKDTAIYAIQGAAAHDLYHAGQIQLLKRLQKSG